MTDENSLEARIAVRARATVDEVRVVFESQGIPLLTPPARPRPLRLHRLRLAGERTGGLEPGPFDTTLPFAEGLTALVAANLRGKTSVLELLTWILRGTPREKSGAIHWLREVDLDATVAGQPMGFRLNLENEEVTSAVVMMGPDIATLGFTREPDPGRGVVPLLRASSSASYADQVQALMMEWMDLHPLISAKEGTSAVAHGWPAYFGAIYLPAARSAALLGDVVMSGLPGRLLQVFLDLPAAGTLTKVKTHAELMAAARKRRQRDATVAQQQRSSERERLEAELEAARVRLAALSPAGTSDSDQISLADLAAATVRLSRSVADSQEAWDELMRAHRQARRQRQRDQKLLNDVRESATARLLFHGLDPKACPRCDQEIISQRRQLERDTHSCAVCTRLVEGDDEAPEEVLVEAEDRLKTSTDAERVAKEALDSAETELTELFAALQSAQNELRQADSVAQVPERAHAREEVLRLEGALSVLPDIPPSPDDPAEDLAIKVLRAGARILEDDHSREAEKLFADLDAQIADLGRKFGFASLESVRINRAAHLEITSDGGHIRTFSDQVAGERLRLRIAVIMALLRVGAKHQVSTHPGLLLIDSPKAEEIQDVDIHLLLQELNAVAEANQLQVLVTTADFELAHDVLPAQNVIEAQDGKPLW
ncbi:hypothetical protein GCM10022254_64160 [Actinomadura meridiana]|uniref:Large ATP-binding protein n=1 Tax=Actinomadura meridiana TaxID=559626 RepID=A0ABP8CK73_9ACTN